MLLRPTLYPIPAPASARLSIVARPRGNDWLDDELAGLRRAGVDTVVCLLTVTERDELGLRDEADAALRTGLDFHAFPIADLGVPDHAAIRPTLALLTDQLRQGRHVTMHCRASIGRSSLLAAALLARLGVPVEQVWELIGQARGVPVPETDEQRRWLSEHRR